ncbi:MULTISPECIES: hypothetical protein [Pseudanabaena]|uniref:hypothetical protein n=1 Tax=Pseudanabaena TaxID=1152 RepID=UPI002479A5AF|nr:MULTISPECIES: hypothetical protein [Pseudanabaena]MEA5489031.1 hypothetical protein [Pseudanabaena sp. CCNP1317]WGS72943.1 hypothetical protein OA858_02650 [Pseudanabaena galeata CCNP1313]
MINLFKSWWRSYQFSSALKGKKFKLAEKIFQEIQKSDANLSILESLYLENQRLISSLDIYKKETLGLRKRVSEIHESQNLVALPVTTKLANDTIEVNSEIVKFICHETKFRFESGDTEFLQFTGIDNEVFDELESKLANYINRNLSDYHPDEIRLAYQELKKVKLGKDPDYSYPLIEYVYLLEYFLDNTYCSYLAWFLIYRSGKLKNNLKILDVAAGHGTMLYGLAGLIERLHKSGLETSMHINYHALEQQDLFLKIGLEFWQEYTSDNHPSSNTFWRLDSSNLFDYYKQKVDNLPVEFFDFIVVSHCFFWEYDRRATSTQIYSDIFQKHLAKDGYVILIVQASKLFSLFDEKRKTKEIEAEIIQDFIDSFSLKLVWYKRVDSTMQRGKMNMLIHEFAKENLPLQKHLSPIKKSLFNLRFDCYYILDDYVILARI